MLGVVGQQCGVRLFARGLRYKATTDSSPVFSIWIACVTEGSATGDGKEENKRERPLALLLNVASHAGVLRGARFSSPPPPPTNACSTENNIPFPLFYLRGKWPINSCFSVSCRSSNYQFTLQSRSTFQNLESTM